MAQEKKSDLSYDAFSKLTFEDVLIKLETRPSGLTEQEVIERQKKYGFNTVGKKQINIFKLFLRQLKNNPLIIVLLAATLVSFLLGQKVSSYYIFALILLSVALGFWNEYSAEKTVELLLKKITPTALVTRNDEKLEVNVSDLVVGDIVLLFQGAIVPADLRLIYSKGIEVNESILTGESATVFKTDTSRQNEKLSNIVFMGTSVDNGSAKGVVIGIGKNTEFGKIEKSATFIKPETDFEKGLSSFGELLVKAILVLVVVIFTINAFLGHRLIESLLFSLAIAVGLTPELLPVIVTVSLSHGAGKLAKKKVIAKQLIAIENLGNMDVLCTDKTGTLTEGNIELIDFLDKNNRRNSAVLMASLICSSTATHHEIIGNSIDVAIWKYATKNHIHVEPSILKIKDEPFDFYKRAAFSVISKNGQLELIAKGAPTSILNLCKDKEKEILKKKIEDLNRDGLRVVLVGKKKIEKEKENYSWDDVNNLEILGYLTFLDIPKLSVKEALLRLRNLNVSVKIVTGDNEIVTRKVCREVGMKITKILLGDQISKLSDEELKDKVKQTNIFARVTPEQKLMIIKAIKANGHTVSYLGDGVNDISSLRNADVGISVNTAVDVAKDAATIVLLRKSLNVVADGIMEGRRTFNNTIKYILMATSSNFGNMFSAAGASFILPFLPMTPTQILLTNGLYDISQLSIPTDNVDPESLLKPRHWDINFIKNYMIFFGPISSVYDFLTFGAMFYFFQAKPALFQTGWFIESLATEILVVFVIRTARTPFFLSRPGKYLLITCLLIVALGIFLPFTSLGKTFGFTALPALYFIILIFLVSTYLILVEVLKKLFLKKLSF